MADPSNQGTSGVLNENTQGDDRASTIDLKISKVLLKFEFSIIFRPVPGPTAHGQCI